MRQGERYFDAHLYLANWGTRRLMLRLKSEQVSAKSLRPYFVGGAARTPSAGKHVIVQLCSDDEEPDYCADEADDDSLATLALLRTELLEGDFRVAYLAWLLALQAGDVADDAIEPPMPPGLADLTVAQQAMVEFLRLDPHLLSAAAAASPALINDSAAARRWLLALKPRAKDEWMERAITNPNLALGTEVRRTFSAADKDSSRQPSTAGHRATRRGGRRPHKKRASRSAPGVAIVNRSRQTHKALNLRPHEAVGGSYRVARGDTQAGTRCRERDLAAPLPAAARASS